MQPHTSMTRSAGHKQHSGESPEQNPAGDTDAAKENSVGPSASPSAPPTGRLKRQKKERPLLIWKARPSPEFRQLLMKLRQRSHISQEEMRRWGGGRVRNYRGVERGWREPWDDPAVVELVADAFDLYDASGTSYFEPRDCCPRNSSKLPPGWTSSAWPAVNSSRPLMLPRRNRHRRPLQNPSGCRMELAQGHWPEHGVFPSGPDARCGGHARLFGAERTDETAGPQTDQQLIIAANFRGHKCRSHGQPPKSRRYRVSTPVAPKSGCHAQRR